MERLQKAIQLATTADLQRAAMFLEGARKSGRALVVNAPQRALLRQLLGKRKSIILLRGNISPLNTRSWDRITAAASTFKFY